MSVPSHLTAEVALATVLKAAQAISGEIGLDRLLDKLLPIVVENAGADKALFIQERDQQLIVEAMLALTPEPVTLRPATPLEQSADLCIPLVHEVARIQEIVVLADTAAPNPFANDPYLTTHQPRSTCCLPLLHQGQLRGILYLENSLTAGVFTPTRLQVLQLLAVLAATSLENARLFDQARQELAERQQAETALAEERNLLQTLIDNLPDQIYVKDRESQFMLINLAVMRDLRISRADEAIGKTDFDFHPPELAAQYYADEQAILQSGRPLVNKEESNVDQETGVRTWVLATKVPLHNGQGKLVGLVGIGRDITRRKQAEEALRKYHDHLEEMVEARTAELQATNALLNKEIAERQQAEASLAEERNLLRTLIDNLPDQIYLKDRESRFVMVNPEVLRMFGVSKPEEVLGKSDFDFDSPELVAQYYAAEQAIIHSGEPMVNREETGLNPVTGQRVWTLSTKAPLRDHQGKIIGIIGINRDITERKQAEEELQKYRDHLEELVEARTAELQAALASLKTLRGLIPICASCKKIRDDHGYWTQVEVYIRDHSEAEFSHGICPDCMKSLYPEFYGEEGSDK